MHVLQEKSEMVTGDAKTRLASALTQLDKAVDGMHHAAEDKDAAQAGLELGKIKSLLPLVERSILPVQSNDPSLHGWANWPHRNCAPNRFVVHDRDVNRAHFPHMARPRKFLAVQLVRQLSGVELTRVRSWRTGSDWHGPADFRTATIPSVIGGPADTPLAVTIPAPCWSALAAESTGGRTANGSDKKHRPPGAASAGMQSCPVVACAI